MLKATQSADDTYYRHVRNDFLKLFPKKANRVLDIGCAAGEVLGHFKRLGADKLVGIELRDDVAEFAMKSGNADAVHVGDFMELELPYEKGYFDVISAGFVLEHMPDPWAALEKMKSLLTSDGQIIVTLPNIRHISVSLSLLFRGKWEYEDEGIMDRTHLRFFTRSTIIDLFNDAGLEIIQIQPEVSGLKNVLLNRLTLGLFPDMFGYAFNMVVTPRRS